EAEADDLAPRGGLAMGAGLRGSSGGGRGRAGHSSIVTKQPQRIVILEAMSKLIAFLAGAGLATKYALVLLMMAIQSACLPIPSEVIMPFAGWQLAHTQMDLILLATLASLASNLG